MQRGGATQQALCVAGATYGRGSRGDGRPPRCVAARARRQARGRDRRGRGKLGVDGVGRELCAGPDGRRPSGQGVHRVPQQAADGARGTGAQGERRASQGGARAAPGCHERGLQPPALRSAPVLALPPTSDGRLRLRVLPAVARHRRHALLLRATQPARVYRARHLSRRAPRGGGREGARQRGDRRARRGAPRVVARVRRARRRRRALGARAARRRPRRSRDRRAQHVHADL